MQNMWKWESTRRGFGQRCLHPSFPLINENAGFCWFAIPPPQIAAVMVQGLHRLPACRPFPAFLPPFPPFFLAYLRLFPVPPLRHSHGVCTCPCHGPIRFEICFGVLFAAVKRWASGLRRPHPWASLAVARLSRVVPFSMPRSPVPWPVPWRPPRLRAVSPKHPPGRQLQSGGWHPLRATVWQSTPPWTEKPL